MIFYRIVEHDDDTFYSINNYSMAGRFAAELAATDYFYFHGGSKESWPLTFALHESKDSPEIARFRIATETTTVRFHIRKADK